MTRTQPGYHLAMIAKGELGESSKIQEELDELIDAESQFCRVMMLVELSDLIGAVKAYLKNKFPDTSIQDLEKMADVTERAFLAGERQ